MPLNDTHQAGTQTNVYTQTHARAHTRTHVRAAIVSFVFPSRCSPSSCLFSTLFRSCLLAAAVIWRRARRRYVRRQQSSARWAPLCHRWGKRKKKTEPPTCSLASFLFLASPLIARRRFFTFFFCLFLPSLVTRWKPFVSEMSNCHRVADRLTDRKGLITVANGGGQTSCHYRSAGRQFQRSILHLSVLHLIQQSSDWLPLPVVL